MKAAVITTTGTPDVIQWTELPTPVLEKGQVLLRTKAVAVNPIDTYIRAGIVKAALPNPYIIGCDIAGVVESVGSNAAHFKPGDRVWGSNQGLSGRQGTFAEFCAIDEQWLYPIPDGVSSESAAAGALVGITAHLGLFLHGGLKAGEVVFVNGGTGGVGSAVVQLARAAGATVITTAGSAEKAAECQRLGAAHVIAYRTEDIDRRFAEITAATGPIQLWFETLRTPTLDRCISLMRFRATLASHRLTLRLRPLLKQRRGSLRPVVLSSKRRIRICGRRWSVSKHCVHWALQRACMICCCTTGTS